MTEYFDVLHEDGTPTGESLPRDEVHARGLWHGSVHAWVANGAGQILMQQRSFSKKTDPGLWDLSVCGHIAAGDDAIATAIREADEELGLTLDPATFDHLLVYARTNAHPLADGSIRYERLISPTYLVRAEVDLDSLKLAQREVAAVKWVDFTELSEAVARQHQEDPTFTNISSGQYAIRPDEWRQLYPLLKNRVS